MTKEERQKAISDLVSDPDTHREEWLAKAKKDNPALTDAQLKAAWAQAAEQFGL